MDNLHRDNQKFMMSKSYASHSIVMENTTANMMRRSSIILNAKLEREKSRFFVPDHEINADGSFKKGSKLRQNLK